MNYWGGLWRGSVVQTRWHPVPPSATLPPIRMGGAATAERGGSAVVVSGGVTTGLYSMDSMWVDWVDWVDEGYPSCRAGIYGWLIAIIPDRNE